MFNAPLLTTIDKGMDDTSKRLVTCVNCQQLSDEPELDGWHIFSDGADEEYALCARCARARATRRLAFALFTN